MSINPYFGIYDLSKADTNQILVDLLQNDVEFEFDKNKNVIDMKSDTGWREFQVIEKYNLEKIYSDQRENVIMIRASRPPSPPPGAYM